MIVYHRNIKKKKWCLHLAFIILISILMFAHWMQFVNLSYFIRVVFLTLSLPAVKNVVVLTDSFIVEKYYFYGLIRWKTQFNKEDNLKISSFGADLGQEEPFFDVDTSETGLGCVYMIFSVFLPATITRKEFKIQKYEEVNIYSKTVHIFLDKIELSYLQKFMGARNDLVKWKQINKLLAE